MIKGDDVKFEWHVTCTQPELTVGRSCFIIAEDESTVNYDQEKARVRQELTGTALVIDPEFNPLVRSVMNNFVKELSLRKGCKT
ncbi:hypothetical protein DPMN_043384 [Dreissena polymorpha]|uniref:Uncharacterized protein n=1 Tax=Dreissena polymorpha TaxID=45954 RepID=A0A9D4HZK9_DREPO|nr:hypothetical protein DPMN_043384 [Dreissena polymorpha]